MVMRAFRVTEPGAEVSELLVYLGSPRARHVHEGATGFSFVLLR
jgi:hypothetical protein